MMRREGESVRGRFSCSLIPCTEVHGVAFLSKQPSEFKANTCVGT
jgi:hypothetical protein